MLFSGRVGSLGTIISDFLVIVKVKGTFIPLYSIYITLLSKFNGLVG